MQRKLFHPMHEFENYNDVCSPKTHIKRATIIWRHGYYIRSGICSVWLSYIQYHPKVTLHSLATLVHDTRILVPLLSRNWCTHTYKICEGRAIEYSRIGSLSDCSFERASTREIEIHAYALLVGRSWMVTFEVLPQNPPEGLMLQGFLAFIHILLSIYLFVTTL